jgi:ribosomal-protein-alanine N-acetyltransferase
MLRRIEAMKLEYLGQVMDIERASFKDPWPPASFAAEIEHPWSWFRVIGPQAKPGGLSRVEGYIICWVILDDMHLLNLAVLPEQRRKGLAEMLLDNVFSEFARLGGGLVSLEVRPSNLAAQELYRSSGFEVVGRRKQYYRRDNEDAILMARHVEEAVRRGRRDRQGAGK